MRVTGALIVSAGVLCASSSGAAEVSYDSRYEMWRLFCEDEHNEGKRYCFLYQSRFLVMITSTGEERVKVGFANFPGSAMVVQVDDNAPIRWPAADLHAEKDFAEVIEQLKTGKKALTYFSKWPDRNFVLNELLLDGFGSAYQKAKELTEKFKP